MSAAPPAAEPAQSERRDDRVLRLTRVVSAFIAPFLLVAFVILYGFRGQTRHWWAWTIQSHLTSMLLASAYLGGCYFFLRILLTERRWAAVRAGLIAVTLFATLLGLATLLHWDRFSHGNVAFWVWAALYFTAPFLVAATWVANQRYAAEPAPSERPLPQPVRWAVGATSGLALATGLLMFVAPARAAAWWPWPLTPLTARVVAATLCLGAAGLVVVVDRRWEAVRLLHQVQLVMFALILVAALRARHELLPDRPLTWLMGLGFLTVFGLSAAAAVVSRPRGRHAGRGRGVRSVPRPAALK